MSCKNEALRCMSVILGIRRHLEMLQTLKRFKEDIAASKISKNVDMLSFTPSATAAPPMALQLVFLCFCFIRHLLMYRLAGRHQHDVAANHSHKFVLSHPKHQSPRSNRPHHTIVHGSSQFLQACTPHSAHVGPAHHCHVPCRQGCDSIGASTLPLLNELCTSSRLRIFHSRSQMAQELKPAVAYLSQASAASGNSSSPSSNNSDTPNHAQAAEFALRLSQVCFSLAITRMPIELTHRSRAAL